MPFNVPFTSLDVLDALTAKVSADPDYRALFVNSSNAVNPILDDDPGAISAADNILLVLTIAAEGCTDFDLGELDGGHMALQATIAAMLWLYDASGNKTVSAKRAIIQATGVLRMILMRYRQLTTVGGQQLTIGADFRRMKGDDVTIYLTPKPARLSVTMLDMQAQMPFT